MTFSPAKQRQRDALLDVLVAVDGGRNRLDDALACGRGRQVMAWEGRHECWARVGGRPTCARAVQCACTHPATQLHAPMRGLRASARISALSSSVSRAALYWSPFFCGRARVGRQVRMVERSSTTQGLRLQPPLHARQGHCDCAPTRCPPSRWRRCNAGLCLRSRTHLDVVGLNVHRVHGEAVPRVLGRLKAVLVDACTRRQGRSTSMMHTPPPPALPQLYNRVQVHSTAATHLQ